MSSGFEAGVVKGGGTKSGSTPLNVSGWKQEWLNGVNQQWQHLKRQASGITCVSARSGDLKRQRLRVSEKWSKKQEWLNGGNQKWQHSAECFWLEAGVVKRGDQKWHVV